jgi:hypothetical protein
MLLHGKVRQGLSDVCGMKLMGAQTKVWIYMKSEAFSFTWQPRLTKPASDVDGDGRMRPSDDDDDDDDKVLHYEHLG